jgi:hypothetical protein
MTGVKERGRGVVGVGVVLSVAVEPSVASVGMVIILGISFLMKAAFWLMIVFCFVGICVVGKDCSKQRVNSLL